jgi:hypothetical protein
MSITTEDMKAALIRYIRGAGYAGKLIFGNGGEYYFIDIDAHMPGGKTSVRISIAGLDEAHSSVKIPYLSYSITGKPIHRFDYDQKKESIDDFITDKMDSIIPTPRRPGRNLTQRIEALENAQKKILALTDELQRIIFKLDSRV